MPRKRLHIILLLFLMLCHAIVLGQELSTVSFIVTNVEINADGEADVVIIPADKDVKIKSSNGDVWSVGEDGKVIKTEEAQEGEKVYKMLDNNEDKNKIKVYLLNKVIVFYAQESKQAINFEDYELKHVYKN